MDATAATKESPQLVSDSKDAETIVGDEARSEPPAGVEIESEAFRTAQLKSEYFRILILLSAVLALVLLRAIRLLALDAQVHRTLLLASVAFVAVFVLYKLAMLSSVRRALRGGQRVSSLAWIGDVIIETSLPGVGIALLTNSAIPPAFRPLANPLLVFFFLFITLSVLRLTPLASALSGIVAATSYLCAAYSLGWRPLVITHASIQSPDGTVFSYALGYVAAGAVAAVVAWELRSHVKAALQEAETKRLVERMKHDMMVARSIQQSLLPSETPHINGFDIAGWNLPADETGGDFYDWQVLPSGKLVIVLADVTGHGLGPAMMAAGCRAYARTNFSLPDGLLTGMGRVNSALAKDLMPGKFVTLAAVICAPDAPGLELLSAGHGPLFLYVKHDDRVDSMNAQGLPLGILPVFSSDPPRRINLSSGDVLVLATDGLWEWENLQGEQFGRGRLEQVIRQARNLPAPEIIQTLHTAVLQFCGGTKQQDDLTIVIVKRT